MKHIFWLLFISLTVWAQETYYVVQIKGKIVYASDNQPLKPGDKLLPDTKLKFANTDAKAILISSARGRFVLSAANKNKSTGSEIVEFVKNVLLSHDKDDYRFMSTRAAGDEQAKDKSDIELFFSSGKFFVIGPMYYLKINKEKYQINDLRFFMIRYKHQGVLVEKRLPVMGDAVVFDMNELYSVKGKRIDPTEVKKFDLYLTEPGVSYEEYMASFSMIFIPEQQLQQEFEILMSVYKSQNYPKSDMAKELESYFNYAYGNTEASMLQSFIQQKLTAY